MPRLFTALEIPADVGRDLSLLRGGLQGARWVEPENYHVTLRFIGDVDGPDADSVVESLGQGRSAPPLPLTIDGLGSFGSGRPRVLFARVVPNPDLTRLQAEQERLIRRAGQPPETQRFTPHVTLARLRDARSGDVAAFIARLGHLPPLRFTATRVVLLASRDNVGGGPYVVEAAYPLSAEATGGPGPA